MILGADKAFTYDYVFDMDSGQVRDLNPNDQENNRFHTMKIKILSDRFIFTILVFAI